MEKNIAMIKEIIIVTDGCSNVGGNPAIAAQKARQRGIRVNIIGIIDQKAQKEKPFDEIISIAEAGGGNHEYTYIDNLYQTIHSLSYKTVSTTIQEAVNQQLKELMAQDLNEMPPSSRSKLLNYIDDYSEEIPLCCCILMDYSGSMASKIQSARHSIIDVLDSLKNRKGKVDISILAYPGERVDDCKILLDFNESKEDMKRRLYQLKTRGGTPTAAAIEFAINHMEGFIYQNNSSLQLEESSVG
ncbi:vWA domain-containing protein [Alkaliphilus serpentinus]|uniref:VWA domain-containing protein n=1 Tax=Alkaliphilus serpentinus TaxID=1482731 RepID=A0A833HRR1_9FIRM|nr:VWA domain-containing protein [Alkaliphilus serpentinus]KAB3533785.1 VWA domain-containing protein [Alkaliphilus serpentinus]